MLLENFYDSGLIRISHFPYLKILNITLITLGLKGIIVLLRDRKSTVLNFLIYKTSL